MFTSLISDTLRTIIGALNYPVILILLALIVVIIVLLGSLIAEIFTERRHLKVKLPRLVDELNSAERPTQETLQKSGLLNAQKEILVNLPSIRISHPPCGRPWHCACWSRNSREERTR